MNASIINNNNVPIVNWVQGISTEIWGRICQKLDTVELNVLRQCSLYFNEVGILAIYRREVGQNNPLKCILQCFKTTIGRLNKAGALGILKAEILFRYLIIHVNVTEEMIQSSLAGTDEMQKNLLLFLYDSIGNDCLEKIKRDIVINKEILASDNHTDKNELILNKTFQYVQRCYDIKVCKEIIETHRMGLFYSWAVYEMIQLRKFNNEGLCYLQFLKNSAVGGELIVKEIIKDILKCRKDLSLDQQLQLVALTEQLAKTEPDRAIGLISKRFSNYSMLDESMKRRLVELAESRMTNESMGVVSKAINAILQLEEYSDKGLLNLQFLKAAPEEWGDACNLLSTIENILEHRKDLKEAQQLQLVEILEQLAQKNSSCVLDVILKHFVYNKMLQEAVKERLLKMVLSSVQYEEVGALYQSISAVLELEHYSDKGLGLGLKFLSEGVKRGILANSLGLVFIRNILKEREGSLSVDQQLQLVELLEQLAKKEPEEAMVAISDHFVVYQIIDDVVKERLLQLANLYTKDSKAPLVRHASYAVSKLEKPYVKYI